MQHSCSSFTSHDRAPYFAQVHPTVARLSTPGLVVTMAQLNKHLALFLYVGCKNQIEIQYSLK